MTGYADASRNVRPLTRIRVHTEPLKTFELSINYVIFVLKTVWP